MDLDQSYLYTRSIRSRTYCCPWSITYYPWTRSLFYTSPELPIWTDHIPAYLGNSFTCVQYRMHYTCPGPIFQCQFNFDVNLVIELTKFGNLGNWYTCICIQYHNIWCKYGLNIKFQSDFNHDVFYAIWRLFCHIIQYLHH